MKWLRCISCAQSYPLELRYTCECGSIVDVQYDYDALASGGHLQDILRNPGIDLWHYKDLLPIDNPKHIVTMAEGMTPLLRTSHLRNSSRTGELLLKDETRNPTASFKDRPTAIGISKAKELGATTVVIASSGNAGASLAAYAAKARMQSVVFVPEVTAPAKVSQIAAHGAAIVKVTGPYSHSFRLALEVSKARNWPNISSTYLNPYTVEGDKTVAYELFHQLKGIVPQYIVVPVGAGPLLYGIFKGFLELKRLGLVRSVPKMVAVQAANCAPIATAFQEKRETVTSLPKTPTIASGIADDLTSYEQDGTHTLQTIYRSHGLATSVSEQAILDAVSTLASQEGLFVEPSAAAAWAGYNKLLEQGEIHPHSSAVLILTGHGLKECQTPSSQESTLVTTVDSLGSVTNYLAERLGFATR